MDSLAANSAPGSQKRPREACNFLKSENLFEKAPDEKKLRPRDACSLLESENLVEKATDEKLCRLLDENMNISAFLEDASEVHDIFDHDCLDEAQEKLAGVMRSLEEELGASCVASPSHQGEVVEYYEEPVNFSSFSALREETCFNEEFSLHSSGVTPTSSAEELESFELPRLLDNVCVVDQMATERASLGCVSVDGADTRIETDNKPSANDCKPLDLGYLLEASDNELGIAPSPSSETLSYESDLLPSKLNETDFSSAKNEVTGQEPWHREWESNPENFFELVNDELSDQDWFRRAMPSLEAFIEPSLMNVYMLADSSIREYPSFETSAPYLEPAGATN